MDDGAAQRSVSHPNVVTHHVDDLDLGGHIGEYPVDRGMLSDDPNIRPGSHTIVSAHGSKDIPE